MFSFQNCAGSFFANDQATLTDVPSNTNDGTSADSQGVIALPTRVPACAQNDKNLNYISARSYQKFPQNFSPYNNLASPYMWGSTSENDVIVAVTQGGISISTDFGNHWKTKTVFNGLLGFKVNRVALSNGTIFVATDGGLSVSKDLGEIFGKVIFEDDTNGTEVSDVFAVYDHSIRSVFAQVGNRLYSSSDNGNTFSLVSALDQFTPQLRSILTSKIVALSMSELFVGTTLGNLLISRDGGGSFQNLKVSNSAITSLQTDPLSGIVIAQDIEGKIYRSDDRGKTFFILELFSSLSSRRFILQGSRILVLQPTRAMFSYDGGETFLPLATCAICDAQVIALNGDSIFAQTRAGNLVSKNFGESFTKISDAPPISENYFNVQFDIKDNLFLFSTPQGFTRSPIGSNSYEQSNLPLNAAFATQLLNYDSHIFITSYLNGTQDIAVSDDNGRTFALRNADQQLLSNAPIKKMYFDRIGRILYLIGDFGILSSNDFGIHYNRGDTGLKAVYGGKIKDLVAWGKSTYVLSEAGVIYISRDAGIHYEPLKFDAPSATSLALSPNGELYIGTASVQNNFTILVSRDGGDHFQKLQFSTTSCLPLSGSVKKIAVSDHRIYAATGNDFTTDAVFYSSDAGQHFGRIYQLDNLNVDNFKFDLLNTYFQISQVGVFSVSN